MELEFRQKVRNLYRVNRVLWISVFSGVVMLLLVGYLFYYWDTIPGDQTSTTTGLGNVVMMVAIGLLFIVFHMKRTYLDPRKLVWRAKNKKLQITSVDLADFIAQFGQTADTMAKTLILLRRYYMVIWSIANLITLLGFIEFILSGQIKVLLVYGVVSIYSLLINYPSFKIIEQCYAIIHDE